MNKIILLCVLSLFFRIPLALADKEESFVDGSKPFITIEDVNRQAEAWAMCAAVYNFVAEMFAESNPASSNLSKDMSRGAGLAAIMSIVQDGLPKIDTEDADEGMRRFGSLWSSAKITGTELPKTRTTMLLAQQEMLSENEVEGFYAKVGKTVEICTANSKDQQMYIDLYREMTKTGLLEAPSK